MARPRLLPLSGVVFVALVLIDVAVLGSGTPSSSAAASKLSSYYDSHQTSQIFAAFLLAASTPFLAIFGVALASALRARSDLATIWTRLLLVGTAAACAMVLLAALVHFALTDAANHVSGSGIRALAYLDGDGWVAWNAALGIMMLGAAAATLTDREVLPRWLGWVALVAGVALFIPFADFFGLLATLLWILVVGVLLARTREAAALSSQAQTAP